MTSTDPQRPAGYRGALPERGDRLARPWILTVLGIFVLIIVLSLLGVPSRFIPDPTPLPTPSPAASESADPSASAEASESADPSDDASASGEASAGPSGEASASASP